MLRFHLIGHVEARHGYFADSRCRRMRFEPTARCGELIEAFGLVVRADDSALTVHAPEHRQADLWQELRAAQPPATLDFNVRSLDPAFAYYTEGATEQVARVPLGDASSGQAAWLAGLGQHLVMQWSSRQSIWRYWLLGEWEEKVLAIVDTQGGREFESLGLTALGPGPVRQAYCFRSRAPLALSDRAPTGLQLRAGHSAAATRVVVSQLPAPRPTALQYESGPGGRQAVAEIFVSR
ncbi:MAG: hypothetical protein ACOZJX_00480 [Pseudomonadota bacterium]